MGWRQRLCSGRKLVLSATSLTRAHSAWRTARSHICGHPPSAAGMSAESPPRVQTDPQPAVSGASVQCGAHAQIHESRKHNSHDIVLWCHLGTWSEGNHPKPHKLITRRTVEKNETWFLSVRNGSIWSESLAEVAFGIRHNLLTDRELWSQGLFSPQSGAETKGSLWPPLTDAQTRHRRAWSLHALGRLRGSYKLVSVAPTVNGSDRFSIFSNED